MALFFHKAYLLTDHIMVVKVVVDVEEEDNYHMVDLILVAFHTLLGLLNNTLVIGPSDSCMAVMEYRDIKDYDTFVVNHMVTYKDYNSKKVATSMQHTALNSSSSDPFISIAKLASLLIKHYYSHSSCC